MDKYLFLYQRQDNESTPLTPSTINIQSRVEKEKTKNRKKRKKERKVKERMKKEERKEKTIKRRNN